MRRLLTAVIAMGTVLSGQPPVGTPSSRALAAPTAIAVRRPANPFSASARAAVIDGAVPAAVPSPLVHVALGVSESSVNSAGLGDLAPGASSASKPSDATPRSQGQGSGAEIGALAGWALGRDVTLAGRAEAVAPPSGALVTKEVGPLAASPLVYAGLLGGRARPAWSDHSCVIGRPSGYGQGLVADAQILSLGPAASDGSFSQALLALGGTGAGRRVISQSTSITSLVPAANGRFAVASEVRQTVAPVTVLAGRPEAVTVELLGEFVLRATAAGTPGGARLEYGPGDTARPTPVLRITAGGQTQQFTAQQVFGAGGLAVQASPAVELLVGVPAQGPGAAADGTAVSGAADVVRLRIGQLLADGAVSVIEVRLGHMEARAEAPRGGVSCPLPVHKSAEPETVTAGEPFVFTITVPATADSLDGLGCDVVDIRAVDTIDAPDGLHFTLSSASRNGQVSGSAVSWDDLGAYHPGDPPITLTVAGRSTTDSVTGSLRDTVVVTAHLAGCTSPVEASRASDRSGILQGRSTLVGPHVDRRPGPD